MNIIFCGDRNWNDLGLIKAVTERVLVIYGRFTLIEGEARGADLMSLQAALIYKIPFKRYPADWNKNGKAAGPIRNRQMVTEGGANAVIAFHSDIETSHGTRDMVNYARSKNLPVIVIKQQMDAVELYKVVDEFCDKLRKVDSAAIVAVC
jgi:hypothetical protein